MCGIAGVYLRDESAKADLDAILSTMLDEIEHRGGDATGFVALGNEGVTEWQKAACDASDFNKYRRPVPKGTRTVLGHTRWATQGLPAFPENNHPLRRGSFFVIHNGHVSNDYKLFELAGRTGYGQVDSEAIAARFASLNKLGAAGKVMSEIVGAAAIAAVDEKNPADLVLARGHSSPLHVLVTKKFVLWGSTQSTIKSAYEQHIGSMPKRQKIQALPEGTVWHFVNGALTKGKFKAYSPPKVDYQKWSGDNIVMPWKETSTEAIAHTLRLTDPVTLQGDAKLDDELDCDGCGEVFPWHKLEYDQDEQGVTYSLCHSCSWEQELQGSDFGRVNSFILGEDDPTAEED